MADALRITRHVWNVNTVDPEQIAPNPGRTASCQDETTATTRVTGEHTASAACERLAPCAAKARPAPWPAPDLLRAAKAPGQPGRIFPCYSLADGSPTTSRPITSLPSKGQQKTVQTKESAAEAGGRTAKTSVRSAKSCENVRGFVFSDAQKAAISSLYDLWPRRKGFAALAEKVVYRLGRLMTRRCSSELVYAEALGCTDGFGSERSRRQMLYELTKVGVLRRTVVGYAMVEVMLHQGNQVATVAQDEAGDQLWKDRLERRQSLGAQRQRRRRAYLRFDQDQRDSWHSVPVDQFYNAPETPLGCHAEPSRNRVTLHSIKETTILDSSGFLDSSESTGFLPLPCPEIPADLLEPVGAKAPKSIPDIAAAQPKPQPSPEVEGPLLRSDDAMPARLTPARLELLGLIEKIRYLSAERDHNKYQPLERLVNDVCCNERAICGDLDEPEPAQKQQTAKPSAPQAPPPKKPQPLADEPQPQPSLDSPAAAIGPPASRQAIPALERFMQDMDPEGAWRLNVGNLCDIGITVEQARLAMQTTREQVSSRRASHTAPLTNPGGYCVQTARAMSRSTNPTKEPSCRPQTSLHPASKRSSTRGSASHPSRSYSTSSPNMMGHCSSPPL